MTMLSRTHRIAGTPGRLIALAAALSSSLAVAVAISAAAGPADTKSNRIDFNRQIRPILSDTCFACHGPDEKQRQGDLRLDVREGLFADRGGYRLVVPGNASASRLYQRVSAENRLVRMPPPAANRTVAPAQVDLIRRWIEEGAEWETHWAYVPPERPAPPPVRQGSWPRNPIDAFVLARLESEGLRPSPEADRRTLARRVTLDLTGLPPTPAEVDGFVSDRSPDAYEKLVDRLLASPRYGERMAIEWLDLARYADTHGYHIDSHRDMWHWRDWVVGAFNRNLPYDRFTIEQLAGDLLPNGTVEQRIASGFHRNHMINYEGGAIPEEYLNEYIVDRVETTSTVWLGMTLGCARCHDHKYDPVQQREFYRLYAFFNAVPEKGLDGRFGNADPVLELPSPEQKAERERLAREIAEREGVLAEKQVAAAQDEWEKTKLAKLPKFEDAPRSDLAVHYELDGNLADTSGHYLHGRVVRGELLYAGGPVGRAAEITGETHVDFGAVGSFEGRSPFTLALWLRSASIKETPVLAKLDPEGRRGWELGFDESIHVGGQKRGARLYFRLIHRWPGGTIAIRTRERLLQGVYHHVTLTYDGSGKAAGLVLYVNGEAQPVDVVEDSLRGPIATAAPLEIGNKKLGVGFKGFLDDVRIYGRRLGPKEAEGLAIHFPVRVILSGMHGKRSKEQSDRLRDYFLRYDAPEEMRRASASLKGLRERQAQVKGEIPTVMTMAEVEKPRETLVLARGDYRNKGEKVSPGVPAVLPPLPKDAPANRLGLARWLVEPRHPLTGRVAVNRFWQIYFGLGLVKTAEDFGSQGEPPSHPQLLDWLATEFIRIGWDVKGLQRLIVTSATYRQSSRVHPALRERDPENRLLARGPRFRLAAEIVRDNALYAAGILNEKRGGPGVFPYQPPGVWEEIAYGDVFTAQTYVQSRGPDLYRRSLYTFWKRTAPPPSLMAFDAPDREKCVARRAVTNTPLQALVLMNDPTYVEAARHLAARMIREGGRDAAGRIRLAFRRTLGRAPTAAETQVLEGLAQRQLERYRRDRAAAEKLLRVGESPRDAALDPVELAAWTTVASTILDLDETITKE